MTLESECGRLKQAVNTIRELIQEHPLCIDNPLTEFYYAPIESIASYCATHG